MFISNEERILLRKDIEALVKITGDMSVEIAYLTAKVMALEHGKKVAKKTSGMTPEGRAKVSAAVKAYHAKKRLEKQNANSVSTTSV